MNKLTLILFNEFAISMFFSKSFILIKCFSLYNESIVRYRKSILIMNLRINYADLKMKRKVNKVKLRTNDNVACICTRINHLLCRTHFSWYIKVNNQ